MGRGPGEWSRGDRDRAVSGAEEGSAAEGGGTRLQREVAHNRTVHCIIVATYVFQGGQAAGVPTVRWSWSER